MNKLIRGVLAVTGCVFAGAGVAEEPYVRGYINEQGRYVLPEARTSPPSSEIERRSVRRKVYPEPVKERTRDADEGEEAAMRVRPFDGEPRAA